MIMVTVTNEQLRFKELVVLAPLPECIVCRKSEIYDVRRNRINLFANPKVLRVPVSLSVSGVS